MVSEKLVEIWKRQALNGSVESITRLKENNISLNDATQEPEIKKRMVGSSKSGDIIRAFRPTYEVDQYLLQLPKGKISRFINRVLTDYIKKEKAENGK